MGRQVSILALVIVMLTAAACGSSSSVSTNAGGSGSSPTVSTASTASPAIYNACTRQIGRWMTALKALDSRLNIGLTERDYTKELGNVSVLYGEIPFKSLSAECLIPSLKAENAFNDYIHASNAWEKCIASFTCTNAQVRPKLQAFWAAASAQLDKADAEVQNLRG